MGNSCEAKFVSNKDFVLGDFKISTNTSYDFQRCDVGSFQPPVIIGNLPDIVNEIEEIQLKLNKEHNPVVCIVSPPRHGKSLLLDRIFYGRFDIRVVEVTYNNNSQVTTHEILSPRHALYHFWLRFIGSVCADSFSSLIATIPFDDNCIFTLAWAKKILLKRYNQNPFIDARSRKQLPLVIAVDEFSKLTDKFAECWRENQKKDFVRALCNQRQSSPSVQFVFTGFNTEMNGLMEVSDVHVIFKTLSLCDFSSAKPLLKLIVDAYPKVLKIPMLLFETVKSTPGLVGLWAERVFSLNCFDTSLIQFARSLPWISRVTKLTPDYGEVVPPVAHNWSLVVEYLQALDANNTSYRSTYKDMEKLGHDLVSNKIGVLQKEFGSDGTETIQLMLSPLCFVCISSSEYEPKTLLEKDLKAAIKTAITECELRPERNDGSSNNGKIFENFIVNAFKARIIIRIINRRRSEESLLWATFRFIDLLPVDASRIIVDSFTMEGRSFNNYVFPCYLHGISSKKNLSKMLTAPLYYLFPLGLEVLHTDGSNNHSGVIIPLVQECSPVVCDNLYFDIEVSPRCCDKKMSFVSNVKNAASFTPDEERFLSTSITPPSDKYSRDVKAIWYSMQDQIRIILDNRNCSIFEVSEGAAGCDLVILCKESPSKYHIAAIVVKDSHTTGKSTWQDKLFKLISFRCIVPRLKAELEKENIDLYYHIVFAGRDDA